MRVGSLLYQLAVDLNDAAPGYEYTTWSKEQLRAYLIEALQQVFIERPGLFIETKILKIEPCSIYQKACDCTSIRRVIGQSTKDGRVIKQLRQRSNNDNLRWTGRKCIYNINKFELQEYSIDTSTDILWVYPEVPVGQDIYILIECSVIPTEASDNYEIPDEVVAPIRQWVLYNAKMIDGENNPLIIDVAKQHENSFWRLLVFQKDNEDNTAEADNE